MLYNIYYIVYALHILYLIETRNIKVLSKSKDEFWQNMTMGRVAKIRGKKIVEKKIE